MIEDMYEYVGEPTLQQTSLFWCLPYQFDMTFDSILFYSILLCTWDKPNNYSYVVKLIPHSGRMSLTQSLMIS